MTYTGMASHGATGLFRANTDAAPVDYRMAARGLTLNGALRAISSSIPQIGALP